MKYIARAHGGAAIVFELESYAVESNLPYFHIEDIPEKKGVLMTDGVSEIWWEDSSTSNIIATKDKKVYMTKTTLMDYLAEHPLRWSDGKHYSVTIEKQSLLNNAIAVYQIGIQSGLTPELTWNATGEECTIWTFEDLCALALAIAAYVKPLVAHQQTLEVAIMAAETVEEVNAIEIDYTTII